MPRGGLDRVLNGRATQDCPNPILTANEALGKWLIYQYSSPCSRNTPFACCDGTRRKGTTSDDLRCTTPSAMTERSSARIGKPIQRIRPFRGEIATRTRNPPQTQGKRCIGIIPVVAKEKMSRPATSADFVDPGQLPNSGRSVSPCFRKIFLKRSSLPGTAAIRWESTPERIRTSNPRFRRPFYPKSGFDNADQITVFPRKKLAPSFYLKSSRSRFRSLVGGLVGGLLAGIRFNPSGA